MSHFEDRHLDFVLKHYKEGAFDTGKAIGRFNDAHGIRPASGRRLRFVPMGIAAAAVMLLGVFLFFGHESRQWTEITASAVQHSVLLPDGTEVSLASGASLKYRMDDDSRKVKMDGKIWFDVARDESRPFEVDADGAFVKVLGTEFMVDETDGTSVKVYVEDGKVLFARNVRSEGLSLTKGMGAFLEDGAAMPVLEEKPDVNAIAWQRGYFIFDQTPLSEVLDCLSGYYHVSFAATDLSKKLSGEFHTDDLDLIIELIESALDVTIIHR